MADRMRLVYIAGPYRAATHWGVEQNIIRAREVSAAVWALGIAAFCPHTNTAHMSGAADEDVFLAGTLEVLRRCDAIVLVPGWSVSTGTKAEVAEAHRLGLPVFGGGPEPLSEVQQRLATWAAEKCTGMAASWCPLHGSCTCPRDAHGFREGCPTCPLHSDTSKHAEEVDDG